MEETIFNDKELDAVFNGLKISQQKSIVVSSFRKIVAPIIRDLKSLVKTKFKQHTGNLYKSIGVKPYRKIPGIMFGARKSGNFKGWVGHILEDGTVDRFRGKKKNLRGKTKLTKSAKFSTGKIKPSNFFKETIEKYESPNEKRIRDEMFLSFDKYVTRQLNKVKK